MKKWGLLVAIVAVVGIMIGIFAIGNKPTPTKPDSQLLGTKYPELARTHIQAGTPTPVPYNSNPPSSGPHYSDANCPAKWGITDSVQPDECYVHNLEHGGIWITYKPDIGDDQINKLKDLFNQLPQSTQFNEVKAVMTPRAANDHAISVVAWTYVLNLDSVDGNQIRQFYLDHIDKGPELIP